MTSFANSLNDLSYDELVKELGTIQEKVKKENLELAEKEDIREKSYELVSDLLSSNTDLNLQNKEVLLSTLEELDTLLYNVVAEKGNENFGSKSINYSKSDSEQKAQNETQQKAIASWNGKGDILISLKAKTWGFPHGHAAILSTTKHKVIEALPNPGVVHQSATKYWSTVSDEGQYYVKGAPDSAYVNAVKYALKQVSDPYKL